MIKNKYIFWMGLGAVAAFLMGFLTLLAAHAIVWAPALIEIASVTWNDAPTL